MVNVLGNSKPISALFVNSVFADDEEILDIAFSSRLEIRPPSAVRSQYLENGREEAMAWPLLSPFQMIFEARNETTKQTEQNP